jgi:hypothetical protein
MRKLLAVAAAGFLVGTAAAVVALKNHPILSQTGAAASPVSENVPAMSPAAAESHRNHRYASLDTIEEILALPGHFASRIQSTRFEPTASVVSRK